MPTAIVDGIVTRYEVFGAGPPLLLFSPGGFNGALENWSTFGIYRRLNLLEHLRRSYTCIAFDKRESGRSGGRIERLTWHAYAVQGAGLLDELGLRQAHLLGGCIGCSVALAFADAWPDRVASMVLYSPAGGPRYRITQRARFERHLDFVARQGLGAVVELATSEDRSFAQEPRMGPWVSTIRSDPGFARDYAALDPGWYGNVVSGTARTLFGRDTVPGPDPERLLELEIPALIVPGRDPNHATSAARYLEECLEGSEYWDVPPEEQTADNAPARVLDFLLQQ